MMEWKEIIEQKLQEQKNNVAKIDANKATIEYSEKIKLNSPLKNK